LHVKKKEFSAARGREERDEERGRKELIEVGELTRLERSPFHSKKDLSSSPGKGGVRAESPIAGLSEKGATAKTIALMIIKGKKSKKWRSNVTRRCREHSYSREG